MDPWPALLQRTTIPALSGGLNAQMTNNNNNNKGPLIRRFLAVVFEAKQFAKLIPFLFVEIHSEKANG